MLTIVQCYSDVDITRRGRGCETDDPGQEVTRCFRQLARQQVRAAQDVDYYSPKRKNEEKETRDPERGEGRGLTGLLQ